MKTVRLMMHSKHKIIIHNNSMGNKSPNIEIVNVFDEDNEESFRYSTLRDVAIIMHSMVGEGVEWELANELSKRLGIHNPALVAHVISETFKEYYEMSEEEAMGKNDLAPRLYDPMA